MAGSIRNHDGGAGIGIPRWVQLATAGGLMVASFKTRTPLRLALGMAAGLLVARGVLGHAPETPSGSADEEPAHKPLPEWLSQAEPESHGGLHPDQLIDSASQDSFPASDPPAYSGGRTGRLSG